ncbi:hypothetical protein L21SP2_1503 [Salinispira pacifica]|uniref:Uncharacterized protein n=2 Tax=Salinispira pacifica TaxID=1307761 RepID=V5WGZ0_9SPIO|nr:hypothetical protein L21SP2_1503 [Salinispira pacifica]
MMGISPGLTWTVIESDFAALENFPDMDTPMEGSIGFEGVEAELRIAVSLSPEGGGWWFKVRKRVMKETEKVARAVSRIEALLKVERREYEDAIRAESEDRPPSVEDNFTGMIIEWDLPAVIEEFLGEIQKRTPASMDELLDFVHNRTLELEEQSGSIRGITDGEPAAASISKQLFVWYVAQDRIIQAIESPDLPAE